MKTMETTHVCDELCRFKEEELTRDMVCANVYACARIIVELVNG